MLWNNTNICLYSLDKTKRLWYNARVQADMLPVLFCCTFKYRYSSFTREFSADMTAPQSALLCKVFSAKRAAPEPSERRAIMGFYKRTIFCLNLVKWLSFFERRQAYFVLQFFKISRYRLRSEKMCDDRLLLLNNFLATKPKTSRIFGRALMGFFSVQIFR